MIEKRMKILVDNSDKSQTMVAEKLGISQPRLSQYLSGKRSPDDKFVISFCSYFNTTPDYLYGFDTKAAYSNLKDAVKYIGEIYKVIDEHLTKMKRKIDTEKKENMATALFEETYYLSDKIRNENPEVIRIKIAEIIQNMGLSYAEVSRKLGRGPAFIQQYIKDGSPIRLKELDRKNLSKILKIDEQELTDIDLSNFNNKQNNVDIDFLMELIDKVEKRVEENNLDYTENEKKKLIKMLYIKFADAHPEKRSAEIIQFMDHYETIRKVQ